MTQENVRKNVNSQDWEWIDSSRAERQPILKLLMWFNKIRMIAIKKIKAKNRRIKNSRPLIFTKLMC